MNHPKISIVSATYRSFEDTKAFVESVERFTQEPYEFIMVANGVQEPALKKFLVQKEKEGILKLVWNPTNIGVRAFGQAMRLTTTPYVFRCDSDILINQPYWTRTMREQMVVSEGEVGLIGAVGTSNTRGYRIKSGPTTVETDMIMSNCMLIPKLGAEVIKNRVQERLPAMEDKVKELKQKAEGYVGEHDDLESTLDYARYHSPWWDIHYGGRNEPVGYGADDMWWSLLARWAGLKLVTSNAQVVHKDASARPGYAAERHRLVSRGFQYLRTSLSLIMDVWEPEQWNDLPNNLPVLREYRQSGELIRS